MSSEKKTPEDSNEGSSPSKEEERKNAWELRPVPKPDTLRRAEDNGQSATAGSGWEFVSEEARYEWSRACNYHRGTDYGHSCGNPEACGRRLAKAERLELIQRQLVREWS